MQPQQSTGNSIPGLRPVTSGLLRAEEFSRQWTGMPEGMTKGLLLQLLETVPARSMRISDNCKDFLHHLVKLQPAECFKSAKALKGMCLEAAGLALISTYSDEDLMGRLGKSTRTLQRWRVDAAQAGWIAFRDSPDRARYRMGPADAPYEAYGIDLKPIIARIPELLRLRDTAEENRRALKGLRRSLSVKRNRIVGLLALVVSDAPLPGPQVALKAIEAVRRGQDADMARLAMTQADEAINHLESLAVSQAQSISTATDMSGARDNMGAQLLPTPLPKFSNSCLNLGRVAHREEGCFDGSDLPEQEADADAEEVVWEASWASDEADQPLLPAIDVTPVRPSGYKPRPRIMVPSDVEVLKAMPGILATKGWPFERNNLFPSDEALVIAYGRSAANRVGLTKHEIVQQSANRPRAFAVAALLSEFSLGVMDRRAYLLGMVSRLNDPLICVNLWASWKRLIREVETGAVSDAFGRFSCQSPPRS